jgi:Na+-translocating ferredoxin:NAD+ oxidoreductase RnfA subunit
MTISFRDINLLFWIPLIRTPCVTTTVTLDHCAEQYNYEYALTHFASQSFGYILVSSGITPAEDAERSNQSLIAFTGRN